MNPLAAPGTATLAERIRLALLTVALAAIFAVTFGASIIGYRALHGQMQAHLRALASVTAAQSQAALLFQDRAAAEEVLQAIPPEEGVVVAELRDNSGALVARVARDRRALAGILATAIGNEAEEHSVRVDGRHVGTLRIEASGEPLARGLIDLLLFDALAALLAAGGVMILARRLTRNIAQSLVELGGVIHALRADRDFRRRAQPFEIAEIEALRTDFHALLDEIQRRDRDLSRANAALRRLAFRDTLTGLPNRAMLEQALLEALADGARDERRVGLVYFDVDSFKAVNDALGHPVGDGFLRGIAARIRDAVPAHATPARIGGDEFVVLLAPTQEDEIAAVAQALERALQQPMRVGAHLFHPGVSVGHAVSPEGALDGDELIQVADRAMYAAKQRRKVAGARTRWEPFLEPDSPAAPPVQDALARWLQAVDRTCRKAEMER